MDKVLLKLLYAQRSNIPNEMISKLMLADMIPAQGMGAMLSSIVTIDQYKEVLDKNKSLEEDLKRAKKGGRQLAAADQFFVNNINKFLDDFRKENKDPENENNQDQIPADLLNAISKKITDYIREVHQVNKLPESFNALDQEVKRSVLQELMLLQGTQQLA